ncbi:hypothetical protein C8Q76DRAFT_793974 [Earliella scabrosa]|nr:hypothetical protein C8Q76DRAFT_793974 [Earliella scabrosa]
MSRHRFVRNIDINEELEEDAISDGGYEDLSQQDYEHMMNGLEHIRRMLGDEQHSNLSDADIKDALYQCYWDIEQATDYLLGEQERRRVAQERKDVWAPYDADGKPLPMPPMPPPEDYADWSPPSDTASGRHHVPFVRLTQSEYVSSSEQETTRASTRPGSLYTITEMTERTEDSRDWAPVPHPHPPPFIHAQPGSRTTIISSVTTDYGQVIERQPLPIDPNEIPPSPSSSALRRLSLDGLGSPTGPPQINWSSPSDTTDSSRPPTVIELPPIDNMPDIPDYKSKSSLPLLQGQSQASLLTKKSMKAAEDTRSEASEKSSQAEKKSKLSALASSRSSAKSSLKSHAKSSASSASSRSSVTETEVATAMTYPALRPAAASFVSLLPPPRPVSSIRTDSTTPSSLDRNVEQAIQTALVLEAMDRQARVEAEPSIAPSTVPPTPPPKSPPTSPPSTRTRTPSEGRIEKSPSPVPIPPTVFPNASPAPSSAPRSPPTSSRSPPSSPPRTQPAPSSPQPQLRQMSKLAKLAQAKAQEQGKIRTPSTQHHNLILPRTHTEYLTPTANGPTATTAITTSYQSLSGLLTKNQLKRPPPMAPPTPPAVKVGSATSHKAEPKQSKLAMKSKSARAKATEPEPDLEENAPVIEVPMFSPSAIRSRAPPSAFATLLVSEEPDAVSENGSDGTYLSAKEREKAAKAQAQQAKKGATLGATPTKKAPPGSRKTPGTPAANTTKKVVAVDQSQLDIAGLNLNDEAPAEVIPDEPAKPPAAVEKLIEEAKAVLAAKEKGEKRSLSMVVVGHVDAGKSTMMGRLLYDLGRVDEKKRVANERGSAKMGKSSFSWAWELDGTQEERERGITMDIALQTLTTPHRVITILDAPGHKDFIPNMISGASQADSALLVVDAAVGEFEAGFDRGGQTREHLLLVRSLGVSQVIVAVNKLDQVEWSKSRYEEICDLLKPFLAQSGFHPSKTRFVPVAAMEGVNLAQREPKSCALFTWYQGPTLVELLDVLDPPTRDINAPLRFPISNVFKGSTSGIAVSGRVCGGIIVAGERLRIVPGDESATVKAIDSDGESLPWAGAGSNVNLTLTGVDPISLNIGSVLCRPGQIVPLVSSFTAKIIVFDIQIPITAGTSIELFHHSRDVPASISRLVSVLDRSNGSVVKRKPRVLTKNMSAEVEISLRSSTYSGPASRALPIPLEAFSVNKEMGRILLRRAGETIGAGVVLELLT